MMKTVYFNASVARSDAQKSSSDGPLSLHTPSPSNLQSDLFRPSAHEIIISTTLVHLVGC